MSNNTHLRKFLIRRNSDRLFYARTRWSASEHCAVQFDTIPQANDYANMFQIKDFCVVEIKRAFPARVHKYRSIKAQNEEAAREREIAEVE